MNDELIKNKLPYFNEKQTSNDYEIILSYSTFSNLLNKKKYKHDKGTIQASPNWGKRGVGAVIPLTLYLFVYNA